MRQATSLPIQTRRKRCLNCKELFDPDARAKDRQKYCSKPSCQTVRQRNNEKDWRAKNPDEVAHQKRKWQQKHPGYSQQLRVANPAKQEENRHNTKIRMRQMRWEAMFDKSKVILTKVVGNNKDKCCLIRGNWLFLRLTRASPLHKTAIVKHTGQRLKRVTNQLPRSRLYDLTGMITRGSDGR